MKFLGLSLFLIAVSACGTHKQKDQRRSDLSLAMIDQSSSQLGLGFHQIEVAEKESLLKQVDETLSHCYARINELKGTKEKLLLNEKNLLLGQIKHLETKKNALHFDLLTLK